MDSEPGNGMLLRLRHERSNTMAHKPLLSAGVKRVKCSCTDPGCE